MCTIRRLTNEAEGSVVGRYWRETNNDLANLSRCLFGNEFTNLSKSQLVSQNQQPQDSVCGRERSLLYGGEPGYVSLMLTHASMLFNDA
jgi:hypothetical protein